MAVTCTMLSVKGVRYVIYPPKNMGRRNMTHGMGRLRGQPAANVSVDHRGQRMILHARFIQQLILHEQMTLIDRTPGSGKRRADDHLMCIKRLRQRIGHRPNVAFCRGIKGRAVFEEKLLTPLPL